MTEKKMQHNGYENSVKFSRNNIFVIKTKTKIVNFRVLFKTEIEYWIFFFLMSLQKTYRKKRHPVV